MKNRLFILWLALGFASIIILSLYVMQEKQSTQSTQNAPLKNFVMHATPRPLANIHFEVGGTPRQLSDFRGSVILVNFWATWCAPCRREMPQLEALQRAFAAQGLVVLAISLDKGRAARPQAFLQELGVRRLTSAHDSSFKAGIDARVAGLPTTLLVDRQGREIGRLAGEADWSSPPAFQLMQLALALNLTGASAEAEVGAGAEAES